MWKLIRLKSCIFVAFFVFNLIYNSFAQTVDADIRQEIEEIKQTQQTLKDDLTIIKALVSSLLNAQPSAPQPSPQQPPQPNIIGTEFNIGDNPVLGNESAKLILVEFTDYQCPFCGRYARETFPAIKEQYIDKGAIRYAAIDQPLPIHPEAPKAAEASHCAEDQGKFWEMHEAMMARQDDLKDLSSYARALKLNIGQFEECLNAGKYRDAVSKDIELSNRLGINGVPGFIIGTMGTIGTIGTVDENDARKVKVISMIRGAMPLVNFQNEIDAALKRK
jgi:protein-disulfide isomerase